MAEAKKGDQVFTLSEVAQLVEAATRTAVAEAMRQVKATPQEDDASRFKKAVDDAAARCLNPSRLVPCVDPDWGTMFDARVETIGGAEIFMAPENWKYPEGAMKPKAQGGHVPEGREVIHRGNGQVTIEHKKWMTETYVLHVLRLCGQPAARALRDFRVDDPTHPQHKPTHVTTVSPSAAVERK